MQTEWVLRGAEILIGLFYFGFGIANGRSSGQIIDSLRTRQLPLPRLLFWAGVATQSIAGLLASLLMLACLEPGILTLLPR